MTFGELIAIRDFSPIRVTPAFVPSVEFGVADSRSAEGLPAQPGDLQLQRLDLQRLGDQAGPRRRELGRLGGDQRPQRLRIIEKRGNVDLHISFIAYRDDTRY
jgi:hypothetical protein